MPKKKGKQTRLIVALVVLIGVVVAYFALAGGTSDLQGRFSFKARKISKPAITKSFKPVAIKQVAIKPVTFKLSANTLSKAFPIGLWADGNSSIVAKMVPVTSAEAFNLAKANNKSISTLNGQIYVIMGQDNTPYGIMDYDITLVEITNKTLDGIIVGDLALNLNMRPNTIDIRGLVSDTMDWDALPTPPPPPPPTKPTPCTEKTCTKIVSGLLNLSSESFVDPVTLKPLLFQPMQLLEYRF